MDTAVKRALRALAEAGIGGSPAIVAREESRSHGASQGDGIVLRGVVEEPNRGERDHADRNIGSEHSQAAGPNLPDAVLTARHPLAEICRATLDSNPAAGKLGADERRWLAEHLEAAVLNWLSYVLKPEPAWDATCPKGHRITEGIFAQCLLGWCCSDCKQAYPASECRLKRREVKA
jgi:hypothetical protein